MSTTTSLEPVKKNNTILLEPVRKSNTMLLEGKGKGVKYDNAILEYTIARIHPSSIEIMGTITLKDGTVIGLMDGTVTKKEYTIRAKIHSKGSTLYLNGDDISTNTVTIGAIYKIRGGRMNCKTKKARRRASRRRTLGVA